MNQTIKNKINELKKSGLEVIPIRVGTDNYCDWAVKVYKGNKVVCRDEGLTSEINAYETGIDYAEKYLKRINKVEENHSNQIICRTKYKSLGYFEILHKTNQSINKVNPGDKLYITHVDSEIVYFNRLGTPCTLEKIAFEDLVNRNILKLEEDTVKNKIEKIEDLIPFLGTDRTVLVDIFRKLDKTAVWEEKKVVGIDLLENKVKIQHGEKGAMNHITDWYPLYFQRNKQMDPIYYIKLKDDK